MSQIAECLYKCFMCDKALLLPLAIAMVTVCGCDGGEKLSEPTSRVKKMAIPIKSELSLEDLEEGIDKCVQNASYSKAVEVLGQVDVLSVVRHSLSKGDARWVAVYEDTLVFPGTDKAFTDEHSSEYWIIPGTSDVIFNKKWQSTATQFAAKYNNALQSAINEEGREDNTSREPK